MKTFFKKYKYLILLFLLCILLLNKIIPMQYKAQLIKLIWNNLQNFAYIAEIFGIISIIIATLKYKKSKKQDKFDRTIKVLRHFQATIISEIDNSDIEFDSDCLEYRKEFEKNNKQKFLNLYPHNKKKAEKTLKEYVNSDYFKQYIKNIIERHDYIPILNDFEQWSLYVLNGSVNRKIIYKETHTVFLGFFARHYKLLEEVKSQGAKFYYYCRLHDLWKKN